MVRTPLEGDYRSKYVKCLTRYFRRLSIVFEQHTLHNCLVGGTLGVGRLQYDGGSYVGSTYLQFV